MGVKVESVQTIKVELAREEGEPIVILLDYEEARELFNGLGAALQLNYRAY